jgi:hypothetical protein
MTRRSGKTDQKGSKVNSPRKPLSLLPLGLRRSMLVAVIATAFLLVPAAGASAFTATLDIEGSGSGTVEGTTTTEPGEVEGVVNCSGPPPVGECGTTFAESGNFNVEAIPDPGSEFVEWTLTGGQVGLGCGTEANCLAFANEEDFTLTAVFEATGPTVTKVEPPEGPTAGGNTVTIEGTSLENAEEVKFGANGIDDEDFISNTDTEIEVEAPPHAAGTVDVRVVTAGGESPNTAADDYTYVTAGVPTVTKLEPSEGPIAGGNTVIVTGTGFTGATEVKFGTTPGTGLEVKSPTEIKVTAPAHTAGTVDVRVLTPGGESANTSADNYTYVAVPVITKVEPNKGPTSGGNLVTITGINLGKAKEIKFGTTPAGAPKSNTNAKIEVEAPAHAVGLVDVRVVTAGGESANVAADNYTYLVVPTVTKVEPNKGPTSGGNTVTIEGTDFTGATEVKFGTTPGTGLEVKSPTEIKVTAPAHATGVVDVRVVNANGESANTAADNYTYLLIPTVTSVEPAGGPVAGGNAVTIEGTDFTGATEVKFGTTPGSGLEVKSPTEIKVTAPPHAAGTVDIQVITPEGESPNTPADDYTYALPPSLTALSPTEGPTAGGNAVTITGTNLGDVVEVKFGTAKAAMASLNEVSPTEIEIDAPGHSAGAADVSVTTFGGTTPDTAADDYSYVAPPAVMSLSPNKGPIAGGNEVEITGLRLGGASKVEFGATVVDDSEFIENTETTIKLNAPAHEAGKVNVKVTTLGGTSLNFPADDYTYEVPVPVPPTPGGGGGSGGGSGTPSGSPAPALCVVPRLKGMSLSKAKSALTKANCKTGKVTKPKAKKGKKLGPLVVKSSKPGAEAALPAESKVDLKLGPKPRNRRSGSR